MPAHGLGTNSSLEERDGVAVGHPRDEITGGHVNALLLHCAGVEETVRLLPDPLPEAAENPGGLLELGRRDLVLVDRLEQEAPELQRRVEHCWRHPNLGAAGRERGVHDVGDHRADSCGR